MDLVGKIVALHEHLTACGLPHAFGGALALAFCTRDARGTHDIDLNVFVADDQWEGVLAVLPSEVEVTVAARRQLARDGQARLWWARHPVDLFLNTTEFHETLAARVQVERFGGADVPFLDCTDLAVFKAFLSRGKDWVDLQEMLLAGTLDVDRALGTLVRHLGGEDPRIERLRALAAEADG